MVHVKGDIPGTRERPTSQAALAAEVAESSPPCGLFIVFSNFFHHVFNIRITPREKNC